MAKILTVFATSFCLMMLVSYVFKKSDGSHETKQGVEIYHYSPRLYKFFLLAMFVFVGIGLFVYLTHQVPPPDGFEIVLAVLTLLFFEGLCGWAYIYFRKFRIEVDNVSVRICGLTKAQIIPFNRVRKIEITQGARGAQELSLLDSNDNSLIDVSSMLQDFDSLLSTIKGRTLNMGILLRERDKCGQWRGAVNEERPRWVTKK